jgi:iron complex transport system permease protein
VVGRLSPAGQAWFLAASVILLVVAALVSISVGAVQIPLSSVLEALFLRGSGAGSEVIVDLRFPRVLLALVVGGGLAVVGAALQATMRSPLADPYILGISAGASVGAALATLAFGATGLFGLGGPLAAFLTASVSVACVFLIARTGGRVPPIRLLLAGVAFSSFAEALTGFILYLAPEEAQIRGFMFWTLGGLGAADWATLAWTAAVVIPGGLAIVLVSRWQDLLLLGDESALSLGLDVGRARGILVLLAAVVTGTTVAAAGAIGFVGLIVPHAVRRVTGPEHRRLLPGSALTGGALLMVMDALARTMLAPREVPVGLLTGLLGAPFFLLLLHRSFEG